MTRSEFLKEAEKCVCTDRQEQYGGMEDNFQLIANLWANYLLARKQTNGEGYFCAQDVAVMMALLKIARIATGQPKADNFIDLAGYAACAGEIALKDDERGKAVPVGGRCK